MKKLLLALALLCLPSAVFAQCNGIFPGGTVCGVPTGTPNIPGPLPLATFALAPGGVSGNVQTNNGSGGLAGINNTTLANDVLNGIPTASGCGGTTNFLRADGTCVTPPTFTPSASGYVPASGGSSTSLFLNQAGGFSSPASAGTGRTLLLANTTLFIRTVPVSVTVTSASPAVVTQTAHGYAAGQLITMNTTTTMPSGITQGAIYCVLAAGLTANTYEISTTCGGAAINTSSTGTGTLTVQAGNDLTGTGLTQTAISAFMTPQGAVNYVQQNVDLGNNNLTLQMACSGGGGIAYYAQPLLVGGPFVGGTQNSLTPQVTLTGDTTTPTNCLWAPASLPASGAVIAAEQKANITVQGFNCVSNVAAENCLLADTSADLWFQAINFGAGNNSTNAAHIQARTMGRALCLGNYAISGTSNLHWFVQFGGYIECIGATITTTGTPAWGGAFLSATTMGHIEALGLTFSGASTGIRYVINQMAYVDTNGAGLTYFPGNAAGVPIAADTWTASGANCCGIYH